MEINYSIINKLNLSTKKLITLPDDITKYINLIELMCDDNKINSLDNLPPGLQKLNCTYNNITSLDNLPPGLQKLDCSYTKITNLDNLPPGLQTLGCSNNPLQYDFEPTIENIRNNTSRTHLATL